MIWNRKNLKTDVLMLGRPPTNIFSLILSVKFWKIKPESDFLKLPKDLLRGKDIALGQKEMLLQQNFTKIWFLPVWVIFWPLLDIKWRYCRSLWERKRETGLVWRRHPDIFDQQVAALHKTSSTFKELQLRELKRPSDVPNLDRCHYPSFWVTR